MEEMKLLSFMKIILQLFLKLKKRLLKNKVEQGLKYIKKVYNHIVESKLIAKKVYNHIVESNH